MFKHQSSSRAADECDAGCGRTAVRLRISRRFVGLCSTAILKQSAV
jgi:hypothetical protein